MFQFVPGRDSSGYTRQGACCKQDTAGIIADSPTLQRAAHCCGGPPKVSIRIVVSGKKLMLYHQFCRRHFGAC
jgi:hypothetical protein